MTPDHDSYINAKVRAERLVQVRRDLHTALTATRGRLLVEDILTMLVEDCGLTAEMCDLYFRAIEESKP